MIKYIYIYFFLWVNDKIVDKEENSKIDIVKIG